MALTIADSTMVELGAGKLADIDKNSVGLGNVDNTSDLDKPISLAASSALALKADTSTMTSALALKENLSNKGVANGYAGLDVDSKLSQPAKSVSTSNFQIIEESGSLVIKYGSTKIFKIDSSGNLTVIANITAYGSV